MAFVRIRLLRVVFAALVTLATGPAVSPARAQTETYGFAWRGVPMESALEQLIAATHIDLGWDPVLTAGKRVYCVIRDAEPEDALRCLLQGTGLDFYRLSTGTYVLAEITRTAPLYGNLSGRVRDAATGRPIPSANIVLTDASAGSAANDAGWFSLGKLPPGRYQVVASHLGYRSAATVVDVPPGGNARIDLTLQPRTILVTPIVINGLAARNRSRTLGLAQYDDPETPSTPTPGGSDVLGLLDAMMGVRVNDATADLHVQGGAAGEHQFRLDGVPVFIPLNVTSFTGPFSPFALERITVHKAGFDATVGSQIAGVIEAEHMLPASRPQRLDVQVDPLSINARVGLHHKSGNGAERSLMIAGRLGLWKLFAPPPLQTLLRDWNTIDTFVLSAFAERNTPFQVFDSAGNPGLGFHDLHVAGRLRFTPSLSLYSSAYWGETRIGNDFSDQSFLAPVQNFNDALSSIPDTYTWQSGAGQTRFEAVLGPRTLASLQARMSYYRLNHTFNTPDSLAITAPEDDGNRIYEFGLSGKLDHNLSDHQYLQIGGELVRTSNRFSLAGAQLPIRHNSAGWRAAGFLENTLTLGAHVTVEAGSRFTFVGSTSKVYAEPRLSLRFDWTDTPYGSWSLFLAAGVYQQFVNQFDVSSRSPRSFVPMTRFWMLTDSTISPPQALHYAGELLFMPTPGWTLRVEGYYKRQRHILAIDYATDVDLSVDNLPQRAFLKDSWGFTYGAAVQLERDIGPGRVLARYEYSDGQRSISSLFRGQVHRVPWIEPHNLELRLDVSPVRNLTFLARWRGVWGRTWGFRKTYYDFVGAHLDDLSSVLAELAQTGVSSDARIRIGNQVVGYNLDKPDTHTLPPILQLDLSLAYNLHVGGTTLQIRTDVLNALNRANVAEYRFFLDPETYFADAVNIPLLEVDNRPLLPRYTSVALRVSW
ncbi:carboxypeptidase regulatory-like domain-containing protein [Rhodocaloribacter sp.]